jgi:hypothetical protein
VAGGLSGIGFEPIGQIDDGAGLQGVVERAKCGSLDGGRWAIRLRGGYRCGGSTGCSTWY